MKVTEEEDAGWICIPFLRLMARFGTFYDTFMVVIGTQCAVSDVGPG